MKSGERNSSHFLFTQNDTCVRNAIAGEAIPRVQEASSYPVSNAQLRIWLESQSELFSIANHHPFQVALTGQLDIASLKEAIACIIDRHEILRTVFRLDENQELRQYILRDTIPGFELMIEDFSGVPDAVTKAKKYIVQDNQQLFDLKTGPLLRTAILKCADDHSIFYCNLHHIICDEGSAAIVKKEILASYEAIKKGQRPLLPSLHIQYKDYTVWHLQQLKNNGFRQQREYWLKRLGGDLPVLNFPAKQTRPPVKTYNGTTLKTFIPGDITKVVKAYAHNNNGSLFMVLLGVFHALLSRYTNTGDIIIGSTFATRDHIMLKDQVGAYTNTLAIRNQLQPGDSFDSFFVQIRKGVTEAQANQQYPFEQLLKDLHLKKDPSHSPVFDAMLVVNSQRETGRKPDLTDKEIIVGENSQTSRYNLSMCVEEMGDILLLQLEYNTDFFETALIRQFIQHYKKLLTELLTNTTKPIAAINYLSADERVLAGEVHTKYSNEGVIRYFEKQVQKTPDSIAVQFGDHVFTYRELNAQANQLAHYLRDTYKVLSQTRIGVFLDRSHLNVIAMIAVMKAGACYVPLDQSYTEQEIRYILNDAAIEVVLTTTGLDKPGAIPAIHKTYLDQFNYSAWSNNNPNLVNVLDDASFLIYTPDTVGNPRGVVQTHRMLNNLVQWNIYHSGVDTGLRHLQYNSFSVEASVQDCWFVVSSGGMLFITPESMQTDFMALSGYITENGIGVVSFPFAVIVDFFNELMPGFSTKHQLRHIISSGGQLTVNKSLEIFLQQHPDVKLHNHYGSSETNVVASYTMSKAGEGIVAYAPIGKPVPNTFIHLLDKNLQPVPKKVIGEIYIGGDHLAAGYLNLPLLTAERFISSPFDKQQILYKTGDLAFADYNGNIIYLDHNEEQVKVRGYRKKSVQVLPVIYENNQAPAKYTAPRTEVEKRLIAIWKKALGLEKISITDNFFELGGHSLHIPGMLHEINKVFGTRLQATVALSAHNVEELAQVIEDEMSFNSGTGLI